MDVSHTRGRRKRRGGGVSRAFAKFTDAGDQIVKRITFGGSTLATGAGTAIPVTAVSTAAVTGGAEWASFAARYQQYRVRAIRITGKATQPVQTAALAHSVLYRGDFIGSSTPGSVAQVLSDESVRQCATHADFTDVITWKRNPNARLWNPTTAGVPTANTFSWVVASATSPALTTANTYYGYTVEWEVEFRGSQ